MIESEENQPKEKSSVEPNKPGKVVAVVSGKGGSGKTMLAVALAQGAALAGREVVLVDTDFATGGLSYYLTFREFNNARLGLSEVLEDDAPAPPLSSWAVSGVSDRPGRNWLSKVRLVPMGDQRRFFDNTQRKSPKHLQSIINDASYLGDIVIVDCRGGIDNQSLEVCHMVDEILIVVETDSTSIRASQHLTDVLSAQKLRSKVAGFVLNKVMDNPTALAKTASSLLGIPYLGSIPFDIEATRSYIQGRIPDPSTLFSRQVFATLPRLVPDMNDFDVYDGIPILSPEEFSSVTLRSPEVRFGGLVVLAVIFYMSAAYMFFLYSSYFGREYFFPELRFVGTLFILGANIITFIALSDSIKQKIGRFFRRFSRLFGRSIR